MSEPIRTDAEMIEAIKALDDHAIMLLGFLGSHGLPKPGPFYTALLNAMMHADGQEMYHLSKSFPELVWMVRQYRLNAEGYDEICALAGVEPAWVFSKYRPPHQQYMDMKNEHRRTAQPDRGNCMGITTHELVP